MSTIHLQWTFLPQVFPTLEMWDIDSIHPWDLSSNNVKLLVQVRQVDVDPDWNDRTIGNTKCISLTWYDVLKEDGRDPWNFFYFKPEFTNDKQFDKLCTLFQTILPILERGGRVVFASQVAGNHCVTLALLLSIYRGYTLDSLLAALQERRQDMSFGTMRMWEDLLRFEKKMSGKTTTDEETMIQALGINFGCKCMNCYHNMATLMCHTCRRGFFCSEQCREKQSKNHEKCVRY